MSGPRPAGAAARPYRQVARAVATERLQQRIVAVFTGLLLGKRLDEITLDAVAAEAQTTRQTVIRLVGGKDGLVAAASRLVYSQVTGRRALGSGESVERIADVLVSDYEVAGDMVVRFLAQEGQHPELATMLETGRAGHRAWVAETFAEHLRLHAEGAREQLLEELLAVTDIYIWKLFRRDMARGKADVTRLMASLIAKVLADGSRASRV